MSDRIDALCAVTKLAFGLAMDVECMLRGFPDVDSPVGPVAGTILAGSDYVGLMPYRISLAKRALGHLEVDLKETRHVYMREDLALAIASIKEVIAAYDRIRAGIEKAEDNG